METHPVALCSGGVIKALNHILVGTDYKDVWEWSQKRKGVVVYTRLDCSRCDGKRLDPENDYERCEQCDGQGDTPQPSFPCEWGLDLVEEVTLWRVVKLGKVWNANIGPNDYEITDVLSADTPGALLDELRAAIAGKVDA